jgi:hypothetical protein
MYLDGIVFLLLKVSKAFLGPQEDYSSISNKKFMKQTYTKGSLLPI